MRKLQILRQAPDSASAAADGDDDDKRKAIATREWINDKGEKVPTGSPDAVGFRYTFKATGASVDYICTPSQLTTMFAIMGGLTKVGNIVNSIVNADGYDGADPMEDVKEWLELAIAGKWREAGEAAARGPKYDKDVLAGALLVVLGSSAKGDIAHYRERLDDKGYYAKVRGQPAVMAQYYKDLEARGGGAAAAPNTDALA